MKQIGLYSIFFFFFKLSRVEFFAVSTDDIYIIGISACTYIVHSSGDHPGKTGCNAGITENHTHKPTTN